MEIPSTIVSHLSQQPKIEIPEELTARRRQFWHEKIQELKFDQRDPVLYEWILRYLCMYVQPDGTRPERGLLLTGDVGLGKTAALRVISVLAGVQMAKAKELTKDHRALDKRQAVGPRGHDLIIDDIGTEPIANNYGVKSEFLTETLIARYDLWFSKGYLTFGTTNLTLEDMTERYGPRVTDRLKEMCWIKSPTPGKSYRGR